MKSFKEHIKESVLHWTSTFGELRSQILKEDSKKLPEFDMSQPHHEPGVNPYTKFPPHPIHYEIRPKKLTQNHLDSIRHYINGDDTINAHLRHGNHGYARTLHHIETLKDAFTKKENTNHKPLTVFSGIPHNIAEKFQEAGSDSKHIMGGFVSTSTHPATAHDFANVYSSRDQKDFTHVMKMHLEPHTGMSVAHQSTIGENEVLIHPNTKLTYHSTEEHVTSDGIDRQRRLFVHHVTVHTPDEKL